MTRRWFWLWLAVFSVTVSAQSVRGRIEGVVRDQQGQVVPNATIKAANTGTGAAFGAVSSSEGTNTGGYRFNAKLEANSDQIAVRLDHRLTDKHHFEATYNYGDVRYLGDFINEGEAPYPGAPDRDRYTIGRGLTGTLRSTLAPTLVNEFRFGAQISNLRFENAAGRRGRLARPLAHLRAGLFQLRFQPAQTHPDPGRSEHGIPRRDFQPLQQRQFRQSDDQHQQRQLRSHHDHQWPPAPDAVRAATEFLNQSGKKIDVLKRRDRAIMQRRISIEKRSMKCRLRLP
ncbi:MAG: hypothetical protein ACREEM_54170 [Blastocatellia bacterium]